MDIIKFLECPHCLTNLEVDIDTIYLDINKPNLELCPICKKQYFIFVDEYKSNPRTEKEPY